ncbi:MAG: UDP-N-acetylmuramate--alanine ligase, partial [Alphaproteobacteria bacterium]|nr:UDP-N-acetylmuramate--alanine ligase [Alphaproteobacteria bacterium]
MMPLAQIMKANGCQVEGSDRGLDQGRTAAKFEWLKAQGIKLYRQDGSGVVSRDQIVVASTAVEETVPDIVAANAVGAKRMRRADLLADLFNAAPVSIGVAGTSGKSTVTGMIGWILHACGRSLTVMNGAVMKNFVRADAPFASALVGSGDIFVSEVDESDGSIALYAPTIAVLNNIALDHKSMDELRALFSAFVGKARVAVLNADHTEVMALGAAHTRTYSIGGSADIVACDVCERPDGVDFHVNGLAARLHVPGKHNVSNALAALAACEAAGVPLAEGIAALAGFTGLRRRLEVIGTAKGITVIDDFGHNPDKIAASLATLHAFPGRLLILFQPHGYGPLKQMGHELIATFARDLAADDLLLLPDPVYQGGTVDKSVGSAEIVAGIIAAGRYAEHIPQRADCGARLLAEVRPGDRIVI